MGGQIILPTYCYRSKHRACIRKDTAGTIIQHRWLCALVWPCKQDFNFLFQRTHLFQRSQFCYIATWNISAYKSLTIVFKKKKRKKKGSEWGCYIRLGAGRESLLVEMALTVQHEEGEGCVRMGRHSRWRDQHVCRLQTGKVGPSRSWKRWRVGREVGHRVRERLPTWPLFPCGDLLSPNHHLPPPYSFLILTQMEKHRP